MSRQVLGLTVMVVGLGLATGAALWKTRAEIQSSWKNDSSTRWVEETSAHNPDLWLADPRDVAANREQVRPIREPVATLPLPTITTTWPDGPLTDAIATPLGSEEPETSWLDRHFGMVETARRYRK